MITAAKMFKFIDIATKYQNSSPYSKAMLEMLILFLVFSLYLHVRKKTMIFDN